MDETSDSDSRLQKLLEKRGQELVRSMVEEFRTLNREIASLKRELAAISDYQATRDRLLVLEAAAAKIHRLPRVITIEADQNLRLQDGFYELERTSDGTPFRWTGPAPQFSFDIFVDRTNAIEVKLEALSCIDFELQKNIAMLADGESVPVNVGRADSGLIDVTATLPPREGNEGTNIVFVLPVALTPPESEDKRTLGLAFSRISASAPGAKIADKPAPVASAPKVAEASDADEFGLGNATASE